MTVTFDQTPDPTASVPLGRTRLEVSRVALGTAPLGGLFRSVSTDEALRTVHEALRAGLRYLDTAPQYGHGTAERRLGEALADVPRSSFVLSTKVGRLVIPRADGDTGIFADAPASDAVFDFSRDGVLRSLEESLQRLRLDHIDVVYLHDPDDYPRQALEEAYPALEELRSSGVVDAIGVGMNQSALPTRFVRETDIDVVLIAGRYSLLDRSADRDLLPAARERGVGIVVGGVLNSGILADPRPGATFDYRPASPELLARAQRLAAVCGSHGLSLTTAALQFPLRHPAVTSVLIGVRSVAELEANLAAFRTPVPPQLWEQLPAQSVRPDGDR